MNNYLVAVFALMTLAALYVPAVGQVTRRTRARSARTKVTVRVDEPNVRQASTDYDSIRFRPGDVVRIDAGGCVQTGGAGKTWKLYVEPQGEEADVYYHGLIWIPGVTDSFPQSPTVPGYARLSGLLGRTLKIPNGSAPSGLSLRLGYEDDDYGDNGYYSHDDGTDDQCKGVGNAYVSITIENRARRVAPRPGNRDRRRARDRKAVTTDSN
jgi:hypothetical protein